MTYEEVIQAARGNLKLCHACPVCNGIACKNTIPGPGSKGTGTVAPRNYNAWQEIYLNLDTIAENRGVDTSLELFGEKFALPVFAAPIAAVEGHYSPYYNEFDYTETLASGCREAGIAAFTGDGLNRDFFNAGCAALEKSGFSVPTVKPWHKELVFEKWPEYDPAALVKSTVEIALQICGKVRGKLNVPADLTREGAAEYFAACEEVQKLVGDKPVKKLVFVPGRLVNIVV